MKSGLKAELDARKEQISGSQKELEVLFGKRLDTVDKDPALKEQVDSCLRMLEAAFTSLNGTLKSVKAAIEPYLKSMCIFLHVWYGSMDRFIPWLVPGPLPCWGASSSQKGQGKGISASTGRDAEAVSNITCTENIITCWEDDIASFGNGDLIYALVFYICIF